MMDLTSENTSLRHEVAYSWQHSGNPK